MIEPGRCPGGVVIQVYAAKTTPELIVEQRLHPGDDEAEAAEFAAGLYNGEVCLVAFDGDTGERFAREDWTS